MYDTALTHSTARRTGEQNESMTRVLAVSMIFFVDFRASCNSTGEVEIQKPNHTYLEPRGDSELVIGVF
jgi:hypothetical protein